VRSLPLVLLVVVDLAGTASAETLTAMVVSVHDGDTLTAVDAGNVQHKVRLAGIDAPETKQPFGTKSRDRLAELTLRKVVTVTVHDRDQYGRLLADIEAGGQSVNRRMVADGLARHCTRYSKDAGLAADRRLVDVAVVVAWPPSRCRVRGDFIARIFAGCPACIEAGRRPAGTVGIASPVRSP
jgi:hypothetical protein